MIETEKDMGGRRLDPGERFFFACGPELECFNSCCRDKRLPLWPYDLLRLRRGLQLPSDQVLERYAELEFDPRSGWPALRLRLDQAGRCPLLGPEGCRVYTHRPCACRIYPLAWAQAPDGREVFLRQETKGCQGWDQAREHTVESWLADQGLEPYLEANRAFLGLWFHPARKGRLKLNPAQTHAVIAALYNLDVFRRLLDDPAAWQDTGIPPRLVDRAREDELDLLMLGRDWLAARLFASPPVP